MLKIVLINPVTGDTIGNITFDTSTEAERYAEKSGQPYIISTKWIERG